MAPKARFNRCSETFTSPWVYNQVAFEASLEAQRRCFREELDQLRGVESAASDLESVSSESPSPSKPGPATPTTTKTTMTRWNDFPDEIKELILDAIVDLGKATKDLPDRGRESTTTDRDHRNRLGTMPDGRVRLGPSAAVCKEWQAFIEKKATFRILRIDFVKRDLEDFEKVFRDNPRRQMALRTLQFRVPGSREVKEKALRDVCNTIKDAVFHLCDTLDTWDMTGQVAHGGRTPDVHLKFVSRLGAQPKEALDLVQPPMISGPVHALTRLTLPQDIYAILNRTNIRPVLARMPSLRHISLQVRPPECAVHGPVSESFMPDTHLAFSALRWSTGLTKIAMARTRWQDENSQTPWHARVAHLGKLLVDCNHRAPVGELDLRNIIDAALFFGPLVAPPHLATWSHLQCLVLTSRYISPLHRGEFTALLTDAARAARTMPQLRALALFNTNFDEVALFRYVVTERTSAVISWASTWGNSLEDKVKTAWQEEVARPAGRRLRCISEGKSVLGKPSEAAQRVWEELDRLVAERETWAYKQELLAQAEPVPGERPNFKLDG